MSEKGEDGETIYKIKSRVTARDIIVTMKSGKKEKKTVYEKQVIFYSKKYAERERAERTKAVLKAMEFVKNPIKYEQATSYGAAKYIKDLNVDKKTGELRPLVAHVKPKACNLLFQLVVGFFQTFCCQSQDNNIGIYKNQQYFLIFLIRQARRETLLPYSNIYQTTSVFF